MIRLLISVLFTLSGISFSYAQQQPELITQEKNMGLITKIVYSANGRYIASANEKDFTIRVWDIQSDKMLGSLHGHESSIRDLYFHSNGETLFSFGKDKNYIWNLNTWSLKDSIEFSNDAEKIRFSTDEKYIYILTEKNEIIKTDITTKLSETILTKQKASISDFCIYQNNLYAGYADGSIKIFDLTTKKELKKIAGDRQVQNLFSDGNYLIADYDGPAKVFNLSDYSVKTEFRTGPKKNIAFNSKLKRAGFPLQDGMIQVVNYETGEKLNAFSVGNTEVIKSLRFSPDGSALAMSMLKKMQTGRKLRENNVIQIWDIKNQKCIHTLKGDVESLEAFAFGQTENKLYVLRGQELHVWDMNSAERISMSTLHERKIEMKEYANEIKEEQKDIAKEKVNNTTENDIRNIAAGGLGGLKDKAKNKITETKNAGISETKAIGKAAFTRIGFQENKIIVSKTGKFLVTAFKGDEIRLYEFKDGKPKHIDFIRTRQKEFYDLVIDPNEQFLVVGGLGDEPVSVIPLDSTRKAEKLWVKDDDNQRIGGALQIANALTFTADGSKLIAVFNNGRIVVWDTKSWYKLTDFRIKAAMTMKPFAGFSQDGKKFFINTSNGVYTYDFSIYDNTQGAKEITLSDALGVKKSSIEGFPVMTHVPLDYVVSVTKTHVNFLEVASGNTAKSNPINAKMINDIQVNKFGLAGISLRNGELRIYDPVTGKERFIMVESEDNAIFKLPESYYKITKEGQDLVTFRLGKDAYPFEQFDAKFNRPDLVLLAMKSEDENLIKLYKSAYQKRLQKLGIKEADLDVISNLPEIQITNLGDIPLSTDLKSQKFELTISGNNSDLSKLHIWINDVPVYGKNGMAISGASSVQSIDLKLASGFNKIQIACENSKGAQSLKQTVEMECTQKVKPVLYVLTIGTSNYKDKKFNLNYAAKDALDIASLFAKNGGGNYSEVKTKTITNEQATKLNIENVKSFFEGATIDDVVLVFVAGHGVLDAGLDYYYGTHDIDFSKPNVKGLSYATLEAILDGIAPLKKMMFMDTCHSGEVEKDDVVEVADMEVKKNEKVKFRDAGTGPMVKEAEGVSPSKVMKELFNDLRRGTGTTVISSAGGTEFAMESDQWKNGLFTYCLLSGITNKSADLNSDGNIMLSEIQMYVTDEVTKLSGGSQIPTTRIQNLVLDYKIW